MWGNSQSTNLRSVSCLLCRPCLRRQLAVCDHSRMIKELIFHGWTKTEGFGVEKFNLWLPRVSKTSRWRKGRERGKEGGRKGGREREAGREGGKEGGRQRGRQVGREDEGDNIVSDQNNANHKTLKGYELPSINLQTGPREGRRVGREKKRRRGRAEGKGPPNNPDSYTC